MEKGVMTLNDTIYTKCYNTVTRRPQNYLLLGNSCLSVPAKIDTKTLK